MQCRQAFTDTVWLIEREQGAGVGDRRGVQQQGLAVDRDFPQRQAKAVFEQGIEQRRVGKQLGNAFAGWFATVQGDQCRVGQ
ncbi:hypothetical protein D3C72_1216750 [compost metagenome]